MLRFFKDFFVYGIASVLGKIAAIFLIPIYTNILTKEEYGAMALITSVGGIIDLLSNLNIHSGIARDYYEDGVDRKKLISTGFLSILGISLSIFTIMFISRRFWATTVLGLADQFLPAFTVFLFLTPLSSLQSYFAILTRYKKKPVLYSVGTIVKLIIQLSISIYGVVVLRTGIISVYIGFLVSDILGVLFFAFINREYISLTFDKRILKKALLYSLPTLPAILAGWIDSSLGQVLIGKNVSMSDLGVYSIALSFASVFTLISGALHNVWSPYLFENYKKPDFNSNIKKLFTIITFILIIISVVLSLFSREIVLLLSNEGYLAAGKYLTLLCIPMSFYLLFPFASSGVSISRDTKYIGIAYVVGSLVNLTLLFITIPILGVVAVPLCLAMSRILAYTILYKVSEKKISYALPNYMLLLLVLFIGICYFVVCLNLSLYVRVIIAVSVFLLFCIMMEKKYSVRSVLKQMLPISKAKA